MRLVFYLLCALAVTHAAKIKNKKTTKNEDICEVRGVTTAGLDWRKKEDVCIRKIIAQVSVELGAALTYMQLGAYFSQDDVHLLGFAKFFFDVASEEREHAIKLIDYLVMRGATPRSLTKLVANIKADKVKVQLDGKAALKHALKTELRVTGNIYDVIKNCEAVGDDHLVDYMTSEFLDEQLIGQRELAGKISTLMRMREDPTFNEFLFDKKLLNGEPLL